jgi:hypothetical protein
MLLNLAGIHDKTGMDEKPLLLRDQTFYVTNKLEELIAVFDIPTTTSSASPPTSPRKRKPMNGLIVIGSPGTGKSCLVLACAQKQVAIRSKRVLWIHVQLEMKPQLLWMLKSKIDTSKIQIRSAVITESALIDYLEDSETASNVDILIIDGFVENDICQALRKSINHKYHGNCAVIYVSSVGNKRSHPHILNTNGIQQVTLYPWEFEQYVNACEDNVFFDSVKANLGYYNDGNTKPITEEDKLSLITKKYYFGGFSARWMFGMDTERVQETIAALIDRISSVTKWIESPDGDAVKDAPNHLFVNFRCNCSDCKNRTSELTFCSKRSFTSHHVVKCVMDKTKTKYKLAVVYRIANELNHKVFDGIINEHDFISQCGEGKATLKFYRPFKIKEDKALPLGVVFIVEAELVSLIIGHGFEGLKCHKRFEEVKKLVKAIVNGEWLKPEAYNQGGYDLTRLEITSDARYIVDFYQATIASKHDLKLSYFFEHLMFIKKVLELNDQLIEDETANSFVYGFRITFVVPKERILFIKENEYRYDITVLEKFAGINGYRIGDTTDLWPTTDWAIEQAVQLASFTTSKTHN